MTLIIGKIIYILLRITGKRGAALPGLVVELLYPKFLNKSLNKLPGGVIVITGTNGKTTSTKMLSHVLASKNRVLTNPTGSNFLRGITSTIVQHSTWRGTLPYDIGVFELDEAYAALFVDQFKPRASVVLNVMRDQMDRFGEIDYTARLLQKVVNNTTEFVILNRDDQRVSVMNVPSKVEAYYFGVDQKLRDIFRTDDELHNGVDKQSSKLISANALLKSVDNNGKIKLLIDNQEISLKLQALGTYNAQNATAVVLTAYKLKIDIANITTFLSEVSPSFGRGEYIKIGQKTVILQLVKNPGGFRQSLISADHIGQDSTMIAINDEYADGRDVSWLWDVKFNIGIRGKIITAGTRASDMQLRLKYDNLTTDYNVTDLKAALNKLLKTSGDKYLIYATYTAMLELRSLLSKITNVESV